MAKHHKLSFSHYTVPHEEFARRIINELHTGGNAAFQLDILNRLSACLEDKKKIFRLAVQICLQKNVDLISPLVSVFANERQTKQNMDVLIECLSDTELKAGISDFLTPPTNPHSTVPPHPQSTVDILSGLLESDSIEDQKRIRAILLGKFTDLYSKKKWARAFRKVEEWIMNLNAMGKSHVSLKLFGHLADFVTTDGEMRYMNLYINHIMRNDDVTNIVEVACQYVKRGGSKAMHEISAVMKFLMSKGEIAAVAQIWYVIFSVMPEEPKKSTLFLKFISLLQKKKEHVLLENLSNAAGQNFEPGTAPHEEGSLMAKDQELEQWLLQSTGARYARSNAWKVLIDQLPLTIQGINTQTRKVLTNTPSPKHNFDLTPRRKK